MADKPLVMITGAGSGIGKATALAFAEAGYRLLLLGRRIGNLRTLGLANALCISADVRDRDAMAAGTARSSMFPRSPAASPIPVTMSIAARSSSFTRSARVLGATWRPMMSG